MKMITVYLEGGPCDGRLWEAKERQERIILRLHRLGQDAFYQETARMKLVEGGVRPVYIWTHSHDIPLEYRMPEFVSGGKIGR
jgi:hypothetical protein